MFSSVLPVRDNRLTAFVLDNMSVSFDLMNHDVLLQILQYVSDCEIYVNGYTRRSDHPLSALSRTSKRFREECLPLLFSRIVVRGEWFHVLGILEGIEASPVPSTYAKSATVSVPTLKLVLS